MKNKKVVLLVCITLILGIITSFAQETAAESYEYEDEIGIAFENGSTEKETPKDPDNTYKGEEQQAGKDQLLPKTGEVLTAFILVLIGFCLLIIVIGITSLKRLYVIQI